MQTINSIRSTIGANPQQFFGNMLQSNPQFQQFVRMNAGKTPEQAFRDYGYDYNQIRRFL